MCCLLNSYGCFDVDDQQTKKGKNDDDEGTCAGSNRVTDIRGKDRQIFYARRYKRPEVKDQMVSDFVTVVQCRHIMEMLFNQLCLSDARKQQQRQTKSSEKDTLKDNLSLLLVEQAIPKYVSSKCSPFSVVPSHHR